MNIWTQIKALFPEPLLRIGTVTDINEAAGSSTVALLGGGTLFVRGTGVEVGRKAYVRSGVIEGPAPDLEEVLIEV